MRSVSWSTQRKKVNTTAFHPQCDGLTERFNQTLVHTLSQYVSASQDDWDRHIPAALFAYRTSPNEITGESPFMSLYGRNPRLSCDVSLLKTTDVSSSIRDHRARIIQHIKEVQRLAQINIQRAQQQIKDYYDRDATSTAYAIGDKVWVYTPKTKRAQLSLKHHLSIMSSEQPMIPEFLPQVMFHT